MNWIRVGQQIRPVSGSGYRGVITYINEADDVVRHASVFTGKEYSHTGYTDFLDSYIPDNTEAETLCP